MKHLLLFSMATATCVIGFSQADTTLIYFSGYQETTKDNADSYIKFYKQDNVLHGKQYFMRTGTLKSEGNYGEEKNGKLIGPVKYYSEKGILISIQLYNDSSEAVERTYYYDDGKKQSWILAGAQGKSDQKCWDRAGNEKLNCVIEKEARFKGGASGWSSFLEENLDASIAAESGAPVGHYAVTVQFIVSKDGAVSNVKPIGTPAGCPPCATEVVRVLNAGPNWEPATVNDEPVLYQAIQKITFVVEEEKKRRRKRN